MWHGIDVSDNQGVITWAETAAAGVDFVIQRSVRRSGKTDYQFANNLAGCRQHGIPFDVYKYTYAATPEAARREAQQVVDLLRQHGLVDTMIWWDVEDATLRQLGRRHLTACISAACEVIEADGYRFGLYVGYNVVRERWFDLSAFPTASAWTARYPNDDPVPFGIVPNDKYRPQIGRPLWGWQHTSKGRVPGIKGNVDLNICYQDPADWGRPAVEPGVIWCVSIADVWDRASAEVMAAAYPGCKAHRVQVLDAGGIVMWVVSAADVWTREQAEEAQRQLADIGIRGLVHQVKIIEQ